MGYPRLDPSLLTEASSPLSPGTMTSQYEGTKGGLTDVFGALRSTMEWINQERVGGSDEWGGCWDQSYFKL